MNPVKKPASVEDYISSQPANAQKLLRQLRQTIKDAAPQAQEKISYGIPYYGLNGRLAYFAAFKNHIGFYPMPSPIVKFKKELEKYQTAKGTVRFPLDKPLPLPLIRKMVKFKVQENLDKSKQAKT